MDDPQVEDGYTRIANELYKAICLHPFSSRELKVVLVVIRYTYGFHRKMHPMSLDFLSKATGISRSHLSGTRKDLLAAEVLLKEKQSVLLNGEQKEIELFGLNKHSKEWRVVPKEKPVTKKVTDSVTETVQTGVTETGPKKERTTKERKKKGGVPAGLPQPPTDQHKPFQHLAWGFYLKRREILEDEYFNPWDPKNQRLCKMIVEVKARGDMAEVKRRFSALCWIARDKSNAYWSLTPGDLSAKWDQVLELIALIPPSGSEGPVGRAPQTFPAGGSTTDH